MRRLSGLDPMFFYLETPTAHMQVAYVCILDPSTAPEGYSFAGVRAHLEQRLHLLPPFRRRLVEVPLRPRPPALGGGSGLRPGPSLAPSGHCVAGWGVRVGRVHCGTS